MMKSGLSGKKWKEDVIHGVESEEYQKVCLGPLSSHPEEQRVIVHLQPLDTSSHSGENSLHNSNMFEFLPYAKNLTYVFSGNLHNNSRRLVPLLTSSYSRALENLRNETSSPRW